MNTTAPATESTAHRGLSSQERELLLESTFGADMDTRKAKMIEVVEAYINGLGNKDFSRVPFAPDFTYESPLLPALVGQPNLVGEAAIEFLRGLFPAIIGVRIKQHIAEGEYCASLFDFHTIHGVIPILDRFHVVDGRLKLANPFYVPTPILKATGAQETRHAQLRATAQAYFAGLERADFARIPFSANAILRAPLAPGGVQRPLVGKEQLEQIWWAPLKGAIGRVEILDHYINEDATSICTEALVSIAGTDIVLRVADRFTVDSAGLITEQENHFDPRDVTNPGWATPMNS